LPRIRRRIEVLAYAAKIDTGEPRPGFPVVIGGGGVEVLIFSAEQFAEE
jgi:hypothetical protein